MATSCKVDTSSAFLCYRHDSLSPSREREEEGSKQSDEEGERKDIVNVFHCGLDTKTLSLDCPPSPGFLCHILPFSPLSHSFRLWAIDQMYTGTSLSLPPHPPPPVSPSLFLSQLSLCDCQQTSLSLSFSFPPAPPLFDCTLNRLPYCFTYKTGPSLPLPRVHDPHVRMALSNAGKRAYIGPNASKAPTCLQQSLQQILQHVRMCVRSCVFNVYVCVHTCMHVEYLKIVNTQKLYVSEREQ